MAISMLKIRRPLGRLIFNMGIAILDKTVFLIETALRFPSSCPIHTLFADDLAMQAMPLTKFVKSEYGLAQKT